MEKIYEILQSGIYGLAIGDALGVPVEFMKRKELKWRPVYKMMEFGTHLQEKGTWSDDTALSIATLNALSKEPYSIKNVAQNFIKWYQDGEFAINQKVFDVGLTTSISIIRLTAGANPVKTGGNSEYTNGNGSLMRMLPVAFFLKDESNLERRKQIIYDISSITHAHMRSKIACHIYVELAICLIHQQSIKEAYESTMKNLRYYYEKVLNESEIVHFQRVFSGELLNLKKREIESTGYVVHSLEACIWCVLHTRSYRAAVLTAVNLGGDTDTIASLTGGLAGILYGKHKIPKKWIKNLKGKDLLENEIHCYIKKRTDSQSM